MDLDPQYSDCVWVRWDKTPPGVPEQRTDFEGKTVQNPHFEGLGQKRHFFLGHLAKKTRITPRSMCFQFRMKGVRPGLFRYSEPCP